MSFKGFTGGIARLNHSLNEIEREAARREAAAIAQERAYEQRLKDYASELADFVRDVDTAHAGIDGYRGVTLRQIHDALGRTRQGDTIAALAIAGVYPDGRCPASYSFKNLALDGYDWLSHSSRSTVSRRLLRAEGSKL